MHCYVNMIRYERLISNTKTTCHPSNVIERSRDVALFGSMAYFWPAMGIFTVYIVRHKAHREIWCSALFFLLFTIYRLFSVGMRGKLAGGVDYLGKSFCHALATTTLFFYVYRLHLTAFVLSLQL